MEGAIHVFSTFAYTKMQQGRFVSAICVWLCLTRSCILHLLVGSTCRTQDLQVSKLRRLPLAWGTGFRRDHQLVWHCSTASTTGYTPRGGTACSNIGTSDLLCFPLTPSSALRPGHSTVSNIFIFQLISMKASFVGNVGWWVPQKSGTGIGSCATVASCGTTCKFNQF